VSTTTTLVTVLIVMACLWAMTIWALLITARVRNRSSTRRSPTPSTTPTPTSDEVVSTMERMAKDSLTQMRELALDLTQGRESAQTNGTTETPPIWSVRQSEYDYDSTPLSPGIEAVLERELEETAQARLLREREELQRHLLEKQAEMDRLASEPSLQQGPWNAVEEPPT